MNRAEDRAQRIREQLEAAFETSVLEVQDDSHLHAGHAGAGGLGHFTVRLTATAFEGKSLLERHRMIYAALHELMQTDIHALRIHAQAPSDQRAPTKKGITT
ncbi:MAG TPA: BolA family transcriptional regulator [Gammaproteobacteria bacterium]|nr:BolA family transcriptional regulator [Gammaproteobacteria bacterium]